MFPMMGYDWGHWFLFAGFEDERRRYVSMVKQRKMREVEIRSKSNMFSSVLFCFVCYRDKMLPFPDL